MIPMPHGGEFSMRIITGEYRGRKLKTPKGNGIRPTSDKVKESIFNLLMNETYNRTFCDLFAGTGSLGLEALSRGAKRCYFCDNSRESIGIIKENVAHCGAETESIIIHGDYSRALSKIAEKIDVFLLDPPYNTGLYEKCFRLIERLDLLSLNGIILAEHASFDKLPDTVGGIAKIREKRYGKTTVSIYGFSVYATGKDSSREDDI